MNIKKCTKCCVEKPIEEFHNHAHTRDKKVPKCKSCTKAYAAQWNRITSEERKAYREKNKDAIVSNRKKYYLENKQEILLKNKVWAELNPDSVHDSIDKFRIENPEKMREFRCKWRQSNPDKIAAGASKKRASVIGSLVAWSDPLKIAEIYAECARITRETGIKHEVDHIVPLNSEVVSGLHVEFNLQIITATQNRSKGNKFHP